MPIAVKEKSANISLEGILVEDVHHMIRTLSTEDSITGAVGPDTADREVRTWTDQGYYIHTVLNLGVTDINGVFGVRLLYFLVKPAAGVAIKP